MIQLGNRRLRVLPTCSWASHDLEDCKTLQQQQEVFHLVAVAREVEELPDLLACSPRPATLNKKKTRKSISNALVHENYFTKFSSLDLLLDHFSTNPGNNNLVLEAIISLAYSLSSPCYPTRTRSTLITTTLNCKTPFQL